MRLMFRPRVLCAIATLALSVAVAGDARAQSLAEPKTWTVTGFLGGSLHTDTPSVDGIDKNLVGNSMAIGGAVGYDLTSNVGFEGEYGYLFDLAGDTDLVDWSVTNVNGNFLYHFDVKHVTPYATFGIGFEHSKLDTPRDTPNDIDNSTEVAFNFGGGVKYQLTPKLLLRGDLRRFESNDVAPDYWRLYAGLTFRLGR